jgi:hypothetical protein
LQKNDMECHPERIPALFLSRRSLAGAGRREGSAFCGNSWQFFLGRGFDVCVGTTVLRQNTASAVPQPPQIMSGFSR